MLSYCCIKVSTNILRYRQGSTPQHTETAATAALFSVCDDNEYRGVWCGGTIISNIDLEGQSMLANVSYFLNVYFDWNLILV